MTDPSLPVFLAVEDFLKTSISEMQAELENFRQFIKVIGLTAREQEFLRILQVGQHGQLNGKFIYELEKDLEVPVTPMPFRTREEMELDMIVWKKQLHSLLTSIKTAYGWNGSSMRSFLDSSRTSSRGNQASKHVFDNPLRSIVNEQSFARNSTVKNEFEKQKSQIVVPTKQIPSPIEPIVGLSASSAKSSQILQLSSNITSQIQAILDLFKPRKVRELRLLFRASEHAFSTASFHHHCDVVPNTLTLVKTQFGCIIGGFTPLIWNRARDGHYETDTQLESFLFSLTLRQKMPIQDPARAIANDANFGPVFGSGHDLAISDQANRCRNSISEFPTSYNNSLPRNQNSIQQFCGQSKGSSFQVQQWEVFEVRFDE